MAFTLVVNPAAGRGRTRKLLPELRAAASDLGVDLVMSIGPDDVGRIARAVASAGNDLVACGGDGFVGELAGVAADHGRRLAVVPTGSGNDFARALGYDPRHPLEALRVLRHGVDRPIDLGRVNGRWFGCVASSGFDAEANRWANARRHLSGTPLYVAGVLRTLAVYHPHPFRLTVDGDGAHEMDAWLVAIGNGPSYGGGMRIAPNARLDDGLLDVTIVGSITRYDFLRTFPRVFKGTHIEHHGVRTLRGAHIELQSLDDRTPMEVYADGERVGPLPAIVDAVRSALTVRVPN